jgi:hypothetical protein
MSNNHTITFILCGLHTKSIFGEECELSEGRATLWLAPGGWLTSLYVSQLQKKVSGIKIVAPDGADADAEVNVDVDIDIDANVNVNLNEENVFRSHPGGEIERNRA